MKKSILYVLAAMIVFSHVSAYALTVNARSTSSGVYEDGVFTQKSDGFEAVYIVDEAKGEITLRKIIEDNREGKAEEGVSYEITNAMISEGPSALLVSRDKKGQKIFTAVREVDLGASETLMIGRDFYQFLRAENGKFYLEYGKVSAK